MFPSNNFLYCSSTFLSQGWQYNICISTTILPPPYSYVKHIVLLLHHIFISMNQVRHIRFSHDILLWVTLIVRWRRPGEPSHCLLVTLRLVTFLSRKNCVLTYYPIIGIRAKVTSLIPRESIVKEEIIANSLVA